MIRPFFAVVRQAARRWFLLSAVTLMSCQSMTLSPDAENLPVVEVRGAYPSEIASACDEVFNSEGFRLAAIEGGSRTYEKSGSWMQEAAYGSWLSKGVAERLQVEIRNLGADSHVIECEPLLVSHAGTQIEDARGVPKWKRGKYQKMLDQINDRLTHPS